MIEEDKFCIICCWNEAHVFYDDSEYCPPLPETYAHNLWKYTGYNPVVNSGSYNPCYCCMECLLYTIMGCNFEGKYYNLIEIRQRYAIKEVSIKYNLPEELFREIYHYIY